MKTRIIHTKFYQDSYILSLTALERWLFIYLITNERIEKTGAYELPIQIAEVETGLKEPEILRILEKFTKDGKIFYIENFIVIKNSKKYSDFSKGSAKQRQSYDKELEALPQTISEIVKNQNLTSYKLVTNQLKTGSKLVIKHKTKIINNKEKKIKEKNENKNLKFDKKYFLKNYKQILWDCIKEFRGKKGYENRDFIGVMDEFKEKIQFKDYKYTNYRLAYLNWVRNSTRRIKKYESVYDRQDGTISQSWKEHDNIQYADGVKQNLESLIKRL